VGPSGYGKSTLLRMIAGLEETSEGQIRIGARDVTRMDPAEQGVAMVFQTYALYPHMTVEENMGFGLKMNGVPKAEIREKVRRASDILKLDPYLARKPKALSGGQRQRVAIGRAIVRGPEVFLFDEPLSNLDAELRVEMRVEIARLHKEIGATMIYVTRDPVEAMTLGDKIVVLRLGRIEQVGALLELYRDPDKQVRGGLHRLVRDELSARHGHGLRHQRAGAGPDGCRRHCPAGVGHAGHGRAAAGTSHRETGRRRTACRIVRGAGRRELPAPRRPHGRAHHRGGTRGRARLGRGDRGPALRAPPGDGVRR
jgi:ABC-type nitrate/sulfonate/bicarbonate transport system ATPase subunit